MTFADTSGLYALLDRDDQNHAAAKRCWLRLMDREEPLLTTNYVLVETCALAQRRLGIEAVRAIEDDLIPVLRVEWIGKDAHTLAVNALLTARRKTLSLVDCVSFLTMRRAGVRAAFAFDRHFREEGFPFPRWGDA